MIAMNITYTAILILTILVVVVVITVASTERIVSRKGLHDVRRERQGRKCYE